MLDRYSYMDIMPTNEIPRVTWDQFIEASEVFSGDLNLVGHPELPTISPFEPTLKPNSHGRPYNLVQFNGMNESSFLDEYMMRDKIKIGCMDKDASGPYFEKLPPNKQQRLFQLLIAGGGVQLQEERLEAYRTMLEYLAQHGSHIRKVEITGHDHVCGYVKHELGAALPDLLHCSPASEIEDQTMFDMLRTLGNKVNYQQLFPTAEVEYGIQQIDREGNAIFRTDFEPHQIPQELISHLPILA